MAELVQAQASGENWTLYHGDCIDVARALPADKLHSCVFSPPFESLYTFSDDPRDLSNCRNSESFFTHFGFLIAELHRAMMPGRVVSIHCMQLPTSKLRDGYIGLRDFRGEIIRAFEAAGFVFHSEVMIRKNPVAAMQRSKSLRLLHKQVVKDSCMSGSALADYVVHMRKPGANPEPVEGPFETYFGSADDIATSAPDGSNDGHPADSYSVDVWQRYAESVWMDIHQGDVLSRDEAREEKDERHISPLQLTVIRRILQMYTNPGDIVFSPFAGIGSELYVALQMGRRAVGAELKKSYFDQAVANIESLKADAERRKEAPGAMFGMEAAE